MSESFTSLNPKAVQQHFTKAAATYDLAAQLQRQVASHLMQRLEIINIEPKLILDIGASTGFCSRLLLKQFKQAEVVSIDRVPEMLKRARKQKKFFSKQYFLAAEASSLPMQDASVDMIVANLLLHWCDDFSKTLKEWQRVLKPEGLLLFSTFGPDTLKELRQSFAAADDNAHVHAFLDMHDIGDAVFKAGFNNPVFDVEHFQLTYQNLNQLFKELKQSGYQNAITQQSKGLQGKHKFNKMRETYEQMKQPNDLYPATYEVIYGHGWGQEKTLQKTFSAKEQAIPLSAIKKPK